MRKHGVGHSTWHTGRFLAAEPLVVRF
jgi:hypothetical protein